MENKNEFKPYISAEKITPEITVTSVIVGIILAVVFGAANAYLGLIVGMTVSASIPAAVIAMGVIRVVMHKKSILESNIVQTVGSAGESLAAGSIFTLPTLFLWAAEGRGSKPPIIEITLIALIGGLLGVFFMIPLRNALIVKEHAVLPYPEGTACAEVLLAGEDGGANASVVFSGMGFAAFFKFVIDGLRLAADKISFAVSGFPGEIGIQVSPAVLSVGYICGVRIASYMFAGGVLSWLAIIPLITYFSPDASILYTVGGAESVWGSYIRYIGAGALAAGGIISLIKSLPIILSTFKMDFGINEKKSERTSHNISMKAVVAMIALLTVLVWLIPAIPITLPGAVIVVIFGFLFATVSSRMVGLVGSSNNPVSGMAIAAILFTAFFLKLSGNEGIEGMTSTIAIGSVICIVSAIAGDTSQDLKTGYLLGATPKKQQIGEIIGVIASAFAIGGTLYLLDSAWGFGSDELGAPQATLMKMIVEGVMDGNLPWVLVISGAFIASVVEITGVPVLPFAIGIYLPVHLNACILVGGIIRYFTEKRKCTRKTADINRGILYSSGMIAGEGLVGILLALLAVFGIDKIFDISSVFSDFILYLSGIVLFVLIILSVLKFTVWKKENANELPEDDTV